MVTVLNRLKQPLTYNLNDGTSKIFLAKQKVDLTTDQFNSAEISNAIKNKDLIVLKMS